MPFERIRRRLAAWNLLTESLVLLVTFAALVAIELNELDAFEATGVHEENVTLLLAVVGLSLVLGLALTSVSSFFLAGRAMRPINEAFERQQQLIADASHELRTPVAVLRAQAEVLLRQATPLSTPVRRDLEQLHRDAEELGTLLDELLDLARMDSGQLELPLEPVALVDVAEEVVAQLLPLARSRDIELVAVVEPIWGQANLTRTRQVVRALAENALKYTPRGGRVRVGLGHDHQWACVTVADTGEGIAADRLPLVFERFYRDERARLRSAGGAGLGLTIAEQLVRLMHGRLTLQSREGQGTTATVLLPLARPARPDC